MPAKNTINTEFSPKYKGKMTNQEKTLQEKTTKCFDTSKAP